MERTKNNNEAESSLVLFKFAIECVSSTSAMDDRKTTLERAFELARSGRCLSVNDIAHQLHAEKYELSQLQGPVLKKQLLLLIEEATTPKH